jgi:ssDNA-binding Zn-finger/Zn-ribbon topoisomerase 1
MNDNRYTCPICNNSKLILRYEASYVYSYVVDSDAPGLKNSDEFLSFLYDKREQKDTRTFIECNKCGTQYPYTFINGVLEQEY